MEKKKTKQEHKRGSQTDPYKQHEEGSTLWTQGIFFYVC